MPISLTYNCDCLKFMRTLPDKFFALSVCDMPYGGGSNQKPDKSNGGGQLTGGIGEYKGAITGRFGGRFEKYHLGIEDRRDLGGEVQPAKGCL